MKDCVSSLCTYNRVHEIHYPRTRPVRPAFPQPSHKNKSSRNRRKSHCSQEVRPVSHRIPSSSRKHRTKLSWIRQGNCSRCSAQGRDSPFPLNRPGKRRKKPPALSSKRPSPGRQGRRSLLHPIIPKWNHPFRSRCQGHLLRGAKPGPDDALRLPRPDGG